VSPLANRAIWIALKRGAAGPNLADRGSPTKQKVAFLPFKPGRLAPVPTILLLTGAHLLFA